jgi:hypothetical protein
VQRSCYRCGASLEEQAPFCPSCGAAQIRVTPEQQTPEQPQPNLAVSTPPEISGASVQVQPSGKIQRKSFLPTALPLAFLTSLVFLLSPRFGWLVLVGTVAWGTLRHQRRYADHISSGMGARLGALMGLLTFGFSLLLGTLFFALSLFLGHNGNEFREEMVKQVQQAAARAPDPQAQEVMRWFTTSQGLMVLVGLALFIFFILFLVSATATGAVVGAVVGKKPRE